MPTPDVHIDFFKLVESCYASVAEQAPDSHLNNTCVCVCVYVCLFVSVCVGMGVGGSARVHVRYVKPLLSGAVAQAVLLLSADFVPSVAE